MIKDSAVRGILEEFKIPMVAIVELEPFYILDPTLLPDEFKTLGFLWGDWYRALRHVALINQGYQVFGGVLIGNVDCHHALLTRADVMGLRGTKGPLVINHSLNVIMIDQSLHEEVTKDQSFEYLSNLYGKEAILEWYHNVPMKTLPRLFS